MKPLLKWPGGKRWLIPTLSKFWTAQTYHRLVEPFVGGAAIVLNFLPEQALLNDACVPLMNFYQWTQRGMVIVTPCKNTAKEYYHHRTRFNELIATGEVYTQEAAELFYYLNRTGFNGLCRFNQQGAYNVAHGRYVRPIYLTDVSAYTRQFANWDFQAGDFSKLQIDRGDFIYADPPYDGGYVGYTAAGFDWDDQVRLAQWLIAQPSTVVASNRATEQIVELYGDLGFELQFLDGPQRISCNGGRTPIKELLAVKLVSIGE